MCFYLFVKSIHFAKWNMYVQVLVFKIHLNVFLHRADIKQLTENKEPYIGQPDST